MLLRLCEEGARFADASAVRPGRDAAGVRTPSTRPSNRDPTTKTFIEQIEALKATTDPGPGLDIPADCTGPATVTPARGSTAPPPSSALVATSLDGTYRWTITAADALAHGTPDDKTPRGSGDVPAGSSR